MALKTDNRAQYVFLAVILVGGYLILYIWLRYFKLVIEKVLFTSPFFWLGAIFFTLLGYYNAEIRLFLSGPNWVLRLIFSISLLLAYYLSRIGDYPEIGLFLYSVPNTWMAISVRIFPQVYRNITDRIKENRYQRKI
jgi:hypothetical protein